MLKEQTVAVIGAGNIGRALIGGMLRGSDLPAERIRATRRNPHALEELAAQFPGIVTGTDNRAAVGDATVVVLAVKPQHAAGVLEELRGGVAPDALVISVL
ncbi:MAG: NAD(P)-binding domain-containing protein, partial [Rhodothermales bacterium]|nr:NAD(P)-binding domain-containing protein [Rhodothermales bacterium]